MKKTCSTCENGNLATGCRGESCPNGKSLPPTFRSGCSQHRECPTICSAPAPDSLPVQVPERATVVTPAKPKARKMNKTERHYLTFILSGKDARYEVLSFRMANGHRYTPDFVVFDDGGRILECHECKGAYSLHSQQRARLAFDQARIEFPGIQWVWAVKTKEGWRVS